MASDQWLVVSGENGKADSGERGSVEGRKDGRQEEKQWPVTSAQWCAAGWETQPLRFECCACLSGVEKDISFQTSGGGGRWSFEKCVSGWETQPLRFDCCTCLGGVEMDISFRRVPVVVGGVLRSASRVGRPNPYGLSVVRVSVEWKRILVSDECRCWQVEF